MIRIELTKVDKLEHKIYQIIVAVSTVKITSSNQYGPYYYKKNENWVKCHTLSKTYLRLISVKH